MYCYDVDIVLQEVPGQISICFSISGCPLHCKGCHSPFLWKEGNGELLTDERYKDILNQYRGYANCVLFMGGEWHPDELVHKLATAKELGFDTDRTIGVYPGSSWTIVDSEDVLGVNLNIKPKR